MKYPRHEGFGDYSINVDKVGGLSTLNKRVWGIIRLGNYSTNVDKVGGLQHCEGEDYQGYDDC